MKLSTYFLITCLTEVNLSYVGSRYSLSLTLRHFRRFYNASPVDIAYSLCPEG